MKNTTKLLGIGAFILTLGVVSGCASTQPQVVDYGADHPTYSSIGELCDAATTVIRGEVVGEKVQEVQRIPVEGGSTQEEDPSFNAPEDAAAPDAPTVVKTISTVQVAEVLHGAGVAAGDVIEVGQLGGTHEGVRYEAQQYAFRADTPYVMFLATFPDSPASLLNPTQAGYHVTDQNTLVASSENTLARAAESLTADVSLCATS